MKSAGTASSFSLDLGKLEKSIRIVQVVKEHQKENDAQLIAVVYAEL